MKYSVKLSKLPEGLSFPDRLRERMRFDPDQGCLSFQGFMTKCTYDELSAISDDADYHRALEQLFVLTSGEVSGSPSRRKLPATILLATIGTAALALIVVWSMSRFGSAEKPAGSAPQNAVSAASR